MNTNYLYYAERKDGTSYVNWNREEVLKYYRDFNCVKIFTKTKDLFPTIQIIVDRPNVDIRNIRGDDIVNKTSYSQRKAVEKYDSKNTKQIKMKLNLETDKAILKKLENVENIQGYIKQLILKDIEING